MKSLPILIVISAFLIFLSSCVRKYEETPLNESEKTKESTVRASYYGKGDGLSGLKTANGERFNSNEFTAAHRNLPFGTKLKLTNPANGKSAFVTVNDRGPFVKGRDLDISYAAARALDILKVGRANINMETLNYP
jgi:rare lipoprotein A